MPLQSRTRQSTLYVLVLDISGQHRMGPARLAERDRGGMHRVLSSATTITFPTANYFRITQGDDAGDGCIPPVWALCVRVRVEETSDLNTQTRVEGLELLLLE